MGLYIHVPFCGSICSYCHFGRSAVHSLTDRKLFVDGVLREFELRSSACDLLKVSRRRLETAYLGGGTPSCLEPELFERLLAGTVGRLHIDDNLELTAEANPESFTTELARHWRDLGVNRVSLGIQSLDEKVLRLLGRSCDRATAIKALETACQTFSRVSADWILGPGVQKDNLLSELSLALSMGVEHISMYILEVFPETPLANLVKGGTVELLPDREIEALYLTGVEFLASAGVHQYEVANFARPGRESRHNRSYWQRKPWLGLGPSAHGYWGRRRYSNYQSFSQWLGALDRGEIPEAEVDPLNLSSRLLERVILALRTVKGVPLAWLPSTGLDLPRGETEGLWRVSDGYLALTTRGFLKIDTIEELLARNVL